MTRHPDEFDLVVCAALSVEKWRANLDPAADLHRINALIDDITPITTQLFVQISTVDVYDRPWNVNEDSPISRDDATPYGAHRLRLEEFVHNHFERALVVRLPALFGDGLKKNFIFDMLNDNRLDLTDRDSAFQFYDLANLWRELSVAIDNNVTLLNITSAPLTAAEVAAQCFGVTFDTTTGKPPARYDVRSKHAQLYGGANGYLYSRELTLQALTAFVAAQRRARA